MRLQSILLPLDFPSISEKSWTVNHFRFFSSGFTYFSYKSEAYFLMLSWSLSYFDVFPIPKPDFIPAPIYYMLTCPSLSKSNELKSLLASYFVLSKKPFSFQALFSYEYILKKASLLIGLSFLSDLTYFW